MIQRLQAKRNEEGFTLIELLIVIIVLGILAAIVVFAVGSTRKDSVASSCRTNVKAVELSAEAINTKMGAYPTGTISGTAGAPVAAAVVADNTNLLAGGTNGALLKAFPHSTDYALVYVGTATSYSVNVHAANGSGAATGSSLGSGSAGCGAL